MRKICSPQFVAAFSLMSLSQGASANLITFDNAALSYRWVKHVTSVSEGNYLDITQGAAQSGASTPVAVRWEEFSLTTSTSITSMDLITNPDAKIAEGNQQFQVQIQQNVQNYTAAKVFPQGGVIGAGEDWEQFNSMGAHGFQPAWFFLGDSATLGVNLTLNGETHYGFISIKKVADLAQQGFEYQPTAWGYESLGNTPITVPSSGAAGVLFLVSATRSRRRARGSARIG